MKSAIERPNAGKKNESIASNYDDDVEEEKFDDLVEAKRKDSQLIGMSGASDQSSVGPTMADLCKCYVMNKSHHIKSRLVYISEMQLYVTYVSEDGESLIVALSVDLENSHAMTDAPRAIKMTSEEIAAMQLPA